MVQVSEQKNCIKVAWGLLAVVGAMSIMVYNIHSNHLLPQDLLQLTRDIILISVSEHEES